MKEYLKSYSMKLITLGPVFIGNGREFGKKEYVFLDRGHIGIINIEKLYGYMSKKGLSHDFEKFVLEDRRKDPKEWMLEHHIRLDEIKRFMKYVLECGDNNMESWKRVQVLEYIKDPFGKPYVPGTSIKGMLRTILLGCDILQNSQKYQGEKKAIDNNINRKMNRTRYLNKEASSMEGLFYHTLNRSENINAVNDQMVRIRVSDSDPLDPSDLILCQRIEKHVDGSERKLNVFRECIRPGTEIKFTLTIDESFTGISKENITDAVRIFSEDYYEKFQKCFPGTDRPEGNEIYIGGGSGYFSKTVLHTLYNGKHYIPATQMVFKNTGVPAVHKHEKDMKYGVSPHVLKCTEYQGKLYEMGKCRIRLD